MVQGSPSGEEVVMDSQVLVTQEEYQGKFVALRSFLDNEIVASGANPEIVAEEAEVNGADSAVIMYVPDNSLACVY
jgi:hypothetical protein